MNNKVKKIGAILVILIMVFVSFVYYENSTEPKGITVESGYHPQGNQLPGMFCFTTFQNSSFLGNTINVSYTLTVGPLSHYVNLSSRNCVNITRGYMIKSWFCMTDLTVVHWSYSNPVVTILNTSLSVNKPVFKNGTDKNDNFGPYWTYSEINNIYTSGFQLYEVGDYHCSNNSAWKLPISSILNSGNYTFYENITYTVSVSMGFMHFTSQPYHLDESWWVVYKLNST